MICVFLSLHIKKVPFSFLRQLEKYSKSPYTIYNDTGTNQDITAVDGLLLTPKHINNELETFVKIGIKSVSYI